MSPGLIYQVISHNIYKDINNRPVGKSCYPGLFCSDLASAGHDIQSVHAGIKTRAHAKLNARIKYEASNRSLKRNQDLSNRHPHAMCRIPNTTLSGSRYYSI